MFLYFILSFFQNLYLPLESSQNKTQLCRQFDSNSFHRSVSNQIMFKVALFPPRTLVSLVTAAVFCHLTICSNSPYECMKISCSSGLKYVDFHLLTVAMVTPSFRASCVLCRVVAHALSLKYTYSELIQLVQPRGKQHRTRIMESGICYDRHWHGDYLFCGLSLLRTRLNQIYLISSLISVSSHHKQKQIVIPLSSNAPKPMSYCSLARDGAIQGKISTCQKMGKIDKWSFILQAIQHFDKSS